MKFQNGGFFFKGIITKRLSPLFSIIIIILFCFNIKWTLLHALSCPVYQGRELPEGGAFKAAKSEHCFKDFKYSTASQMLQCNKGLFTLGRWCSQYILHLNTPTTFRRCLSVSCSVSINQPLPCLVIQYCPWP